MLLRNETLAASGLHKNTCQIFALLEKKFQKAKYFCVLFSVSSVPGLQSSSYLLYIVGNHMLIRICFIRRGEDVCSAAAPRLEPDTPTPVYGPAFPPCKKAPVSVCR
ncbi:hypothetical protein XENOCAPTIV_005571 [Xenoophorus captivus]|uniref:Uncharacterized protein n=1 Tax=Xenoophorus captivus TaxID=1517983 RepID=A0ABV0RZS1_9TELE